MEPYVVDWVIVLVCALLLFDFFMYVVGTIFYIYSAVPQYCEECF